MDCGTCKWVHDCLRKEYDSLREFCKSYEEMTRPLGMEVRIPFPNNSEEVIRINMGVDLTSSEWDRLIGAVLKAVPEYKEGEEIEAKVCFTDNGVYSSEEGGEE